MTGKRDYKPKAGMENRWHVIGDGGNPVAVMKKGDIPALFTEFFYFCFDVWKKFNAGFGLPGGLSWDALDPDLADCMEIMENHYKQHFSTSNTIILYLEALLKKGTRS